MWNQNTQQGAAAQPVTKSTPSTQPALQQENSNATIQARIGKSLVIKGEITGSESVYIDGRVEGAINLPANRVTVGPEGDVSANVQAREVVVQGTINGNVTVSDRVEVRPEGTLIGDVVAERINVADGAFFKGKIDIRRPGQRAETTNNNWESRERELAIVGSDSSYQRT
ncbi:MAG TPA: polymer-forming cytoskeletal protein [Candidatus Angelobacter sp.]|nr:polymer-forming cytoskeletal protein [Candidatus Angelobacter sp.]